MWRNSRNIPTAIFVLAFVVLVLCVSILTPPFQSPDEFNHVKRAYLLSNGTVLVRDARLTAGGMIDGGLLEYMGCYSSIPLDYAQKGSGVSGQCKKIGFSGVERFSGLPNTALYFPAAYGAQAIAFLVGRNTGLSVSATYYLARIFSLLVAVAIMCWAFLLYPPPPICMALFLMPMSVFQFSAASLDAISYSLTALVAGLFLRSMDDEREMSVPENIMMISAILLLSTSRIVYVSLVILLIALAWRRKSWQCLASALLVAILSVTWIVTGMKTVDAGSQAPEFSSTAIALYYLHSPWDLVAVFGRTLSDVDILAFSWRSFVGILGWLDTPLDSWVYVAMGIVFASLIAIAAMRGGVTESAFSRISLAVAAVVSLFLIFFLALVGWNAHPATVIGGVQGRYFFPVAILLAYASTRTLKSAEYRLSLCIVAVSAILCGAGVVPKLLSRYQ